MNKQSYLHFWIGAVSLSLISLVLAMPAGATENDFTCRASALRVNLPLGVVLEPVVANPPDDPCTDDAHRLAFVSLLGVISTGTLKARTDVDAPPEVTFAHAKVENLKLASVLGLVDATVKLVKAEASVVSVGGQCKLRSHSSIATAVILGKTFSELDTPLNIAVVNLLGVIVAKLHLNATLGGRFPTQGPPDPTKVTQRAIWLEVTDTLLRAILADVIVGEAIADTEGNPCK